MSAELAPLAEPPLRFGLLASDTMFYGSRMSSHLSTLQSSVIDAIRAAIEEKVEGATAEVTGGGGHYQIVVTSKVFAGKSTLESQRLVYSAIAHLMQGDMAPVHAVDSLKTRTPG